MNRGFATLVAATTSGKSSTFNDDKKEENKRFSTMSFVSPVSICTSDKNVATKLSLNGHSTRKLKTQLQTTQFQYTKQKIKRVKVPDGSKNRDPTRKLEFRTPLKTRTSSSASESESESEDSGDFSDSDTAKEEEPISSPAPYSRGFQRHFTVSSTVSSVAIAPNGHFLVVGFYNGMVCLYPLLQDQQRTFERGILLDQITPRGMYTQLMVTVSIPQDGKFIFAGVYRGSTEIRAFEMDTIVLPSLAKSSQKSTCLSVITRADSDDMKEEDEENRRVFGLPSAQVVSHTYSDAKLKGFAAAKSLSLQENNRTEYRLLCGIGIKNVHMWRFYQKKTDNANLEWTWECVFDKQTNGISLEFISFHPTNGDQFISKSEHQNVRIWHLEEDYDDENDSVTICKKSHTDVKQTIDAVAVYGDYAYGGSESLAVIDLEAATRMDLDLPLSAKEQHAQREAAINSRTANPLRAWNPRGSRRRGAEDTSGQRHMRTVSKIAGQDASPFTVGMCSDGSVFFHQPKKEIGIATPLDYIEGYEEFFVDPSLDFQAQFSDLTRVNTSGLLAILPLPGTEKEEWIVVAANQDQLLVQSLEAFLHRDQQKEEYSQVKSDLRSVMRDLGGAESSTDETSSDSDDYNESVTTKKHQRQEMQDKTILKRSRQENALKSQERGSNKKRSRQDSGVKTSGVSGEKRKPLSSSKSESQKKSVKPKPISMVDDQEEDSDSMAAVTTPKGTTNRSDGKLLTSTASPVVSISSWSGSSNPNTPEQLRLSRVEKQLIALRELEWTPPHAAAAKPRLDNQQKIMDSAANVAALLAQLNSSSNQAQAETKTVSSEKKTARRMKAQALFTDNKNNEDRTKEKNWEATQTKITKKAETVSSLSKETAIATISSKHGFRAGSNESSRVQVETQDAVPGEPEKPIEADKLMGLEQPVEDADVDLEVELEQLEQYEPEFESVPLISDKGSLLAATMYQYADPASKSNIDIKMAKGDDDVEADYAAAITEQTNLLLQFSHENERLKMNFLAERERIYKHPDCSCAWHVSSKKSSSASSSGINWRRNVAHDYLKRKQLKRRHKKQLAAKLHQLHASYAVQIQELYAMQQLQAKAFRARQQFQHLHKQFCRQASTSNSISPSSSTVETSRIKHLIMPDHLSGASFPYPDLLS
ncbi:hypothetical protein DD238_005021 [Peronospora effusa]|uniref:Uncharacterized protein n=1 Tax=Peronospora effusa TaxID=542832 RepID=A0A3M6VP76_9STRA|nr:hypothetical protein DD238_005021 [Peronospora effusa]